MADPGRPTRGASSLGLDCSRTRRRASSSVATPPRDPAAPAQPRGTDLAAVGQTKNVYVFPCFGLVQVEWVSGLTGTCHRA